MESSRFLTPALAAEAAHVAGGTPLFVYSEAALRQQATKALQFPAPEAGVTVRYAIKASPNSAILRLFSSMGLHFDASSIYEVHRARLAGIQPENISLSSQEWAGDEEAKKLLNTGVHFNACSLLQLESYGKLFPNTSVGVRFNPGVGSGGTGKTNVGGESSSFGIWHELADKVKEIATRYNLTICRIHTHIGSGSDPLVWMRVSSLSLALVRQFPYVTILNLGGGFKVGRCMNEVSTDLQAVGNVVKDAFVDFNKETGRSLKLEIEPGTFLLANSGALLSRIGDIVATGSSIETMNSSTDGLGNAFIKLDTGMTELVRPSLYAAQHPIVILSDSAVKTVETGEGPTSNYVVVGHCCESGDLFSCSPSDSEVLAPRHLPLAHVGDFVSIEGCGAYSSSMSTKNYNSFPEAAEVMLDCSNKAHLIRRRQTMDQMLVNEVMYPL